MGHPVLVQPITLSHLDFLGGFSLCCYLSPCLSLHAKHFLQSLWFILMESIGQGQGQRKHNTRFSFQGLWAGVLSHIKKRAGRPGTHNTWRGTRVALRRCVYQAETDGQVSSSRSAWGTYRKWKFLFSFHFSKQPFPDTPKLAQVVFFPLHGSLVTSHGRSFTTAWNSSSREAVKFGL